MPKLLPCLSPCAREVWEARATQRSAMQSIRLLLACGSAAHALLLTGAPARMSAPRAAAVRMDFGDSFYAGFDAWAAEYPQEDRDAYPELFKLPKDCYEVILEKPLGIAFEENDDGGVVVDYLVEGGNADKDGTIKPGDVLLLLTLALTLTLTLTLALTLTLTLTLSLSGAAGDDSGYVDRAEVRA